MFEHMNKNRVIDFFQKYAIIGVLVILVVFFSSITSSFLTYNNFKNIIMQNTHIIIVAVGLSFVLMGGSLDLSVGYQVSAIGVLTARLMVLNNMKPLLAMLCGVGLGLLFGFINGYVAVLLKIEPLVVTIATSTIFQGVSYLISKGAAFSNYPPGFRLITKGSFLNIPIEVWLVIVSVAIASIIFNFTYFGRYVKAIGDNPEATRLAGVNVDFVRVATFMISSFFIAIASFILVSKQGTMNSSVGPGIEMTGMTAAIIGGISFNSGEGKMWGLVTGVFILAVIENGMQLAGWNQYIQYIVKGVVLLAAIGFDKFQYQAKADKNDE